MKNRIILLLVSSIASIQMYAQNLKVVKADKEYDRYAYIDAIKTYERMSEKGYKSVDMFQKLGNAYYFNGDLAKAAKWYTELFVLTKDVAPEYYYRYAQSLKAIKEYDKADAMMVKFNHENGNDLRAKLASEQKDYLAVIKKNSGRYAIENAGVNSEYSDYGSSFFGDKIVFTSARDIGNFVKIIDSWTGEGFTNLYEATRKSDGTLSSVEHLSRKLNSKFHESTPVFTKDGKTVYFTRNNFLNGKKGKDANKTMLLKIYKATLEDDTWTNIIELPFNSDNYSVAHPALSSDEKILYFASDMPGTFGQSDIFNVTINEDGSFGTPQNLGNNINTEGRETFPFITSENELYFASDGHPGLGGLDVFVSKAKQEGSFKNVLNVGEPLNSSKDDFSLLIDPKIQLGYVTSNREGGQGDDDIYRFKEIKSIEYPCEQFLTGLVTDKETGLALIGAKLTLFDSSYKLLKEILTDKDGKFDFDQVECDSKYYIKSEKSEYNTIETPVVTAKESGKTFVPLVLEKTIKKLAIGDDLAKAFDIKVIYFDLNKFNIRPDAAIDLSKILDVMEQNSNIKIDIRSHTDSRQTHAYNKKLSERRAKSTMEWLANNGINKSRLTAKGYGETQLINKCTDGVECTEREHQANRRSEFIIVK
ncbi:flagellar motor protein MotB [Flavobacterium ranwuense]|uniref:Flagellar motor protein MotB n=1 Tax=Flavobacterium ranwuense TaxID=2541725 RepID=A0ABY2DVM2_9FLAO|nr:OmpA family protein [Flavobacterium ranwuense]TDE31773.1 flagellar motor protein MotB [Flavobacterium ranwuense]